MEKQYFKTTFHTLKHPTFYIWKSEVEDAFNFNPDLVDVYPQVSEWLLEIERFKAVREVGLDQNGKAIVLGPIGRNPGSWPILATFPHENTPIKRAVFEAGWSSLYNELLPKVQPKQEDIIRPVMLEKDLAGYWYPGNVWAPKGYSPFSLTLFEDGTGYCDSKNYRNHSPQSEEFWWELHPGSLFSVGGTKCHFYDDEENYCEGLSDFHAIKIPIQFVTKFDSHGKAYDFIEMPINKIPTYSWIPTLYRRDDATFEHLLWCRSQSH